MLVVDNIRMCLVHTATTLDDKNRCGPVSMSFSKCSLKNIKSKAHLHVYRSAAAAVSSNRNKFVYIYI